MNSFILLVRLVGKLRELLENIEFLEKKILSYMPELVSASKYSNVGVAQINPYKSENAKIEIARFIAEKIYHNGI